LSIESPDVVIDSWCGTNSGPNAYRDFETFSLAKITAARSTRCLTGKLNFTSAQMGKINSALTLHIGVDADTGQIIATELTNNDVDDGSQVGPLLEQITEPIASFTGDGAYDRDDVYREVCQRRPRRESIAAGDDPR
jgi:hypothetical protein